MQIHHEALLVGAMLSLVLFAGPAAASPPKASAALFSKGEELISRNSQDAVGKSVQELETGIAKVREALRLGYRDEARAQKLLVEAYDALLYDTDAPEERMREYERAALKACRTLVKLEPRNPDWLERLASRTQDPDERLQAWRTVVTKFPRRAGPHLTLGKLLCEREDTAAGVEQFFAAARALPDGDPEGIGAEIVLRICGTEEQALEIRRIVEPKLRTQ